MLIELNIKQTNELLISLTDIDLNLEVNGRIFGDSYIGMGQRVKDVINRKINKLKSLLDATNILNMYISMDLKKVLLPDTEASEIAQLLQMWWTFNGKV